MVRKLFGVFVVGMAMVGLLAGLAFAQGVSAGDSLYVFKKSGYPSVIMTLEIGNLNYPFDGTSLQVPVTLKESGGMTYLVIYTKDAGTEETLGGPGGTSLLRMAGLDTLLYRSSGKLLPAGSSTLEWAGLDYNGNPVSEQNLTYYVFSVNEQEDPTWIGYGPVSFAWRHQKFDYRPDPPVIWAMDTPRLVKTTIGTDFIANPTAFEEYDSTTLIGGDDPPGVWSIALDPDEEMLFYGCFFSGDESGAWKFRVTEGGTFDAVTDFGENGHLAQNARNYKLSLLSEGIHPNEGDDGLVWMSHMGKGDVPQTSQMIGIDRATGEISNLLDMSDIVVEHGVDDQGNPTEAVWAPSGHDTDATGVYVVGHGSRPPMLHLDFGGGIIWMNDYGDDFGDSKAGIKSSEEYDPEVPTRLWKYNIHKGPFRTSYICGGGQPYQGFVLGPDGMGWAYVTVTKTPYVWNGNFWFFPEERDPKLKGIMYCTAGSDKFGEGLPGTIVHIPADLKMASISPGATYVEEVEAEGTPREFALDQNYPNPFNPETTIRFAIPDQGSVHAMVKVYNLSGQLVNTLVNETLEAGHYETAWDGTDSKGMEVSSGVYFYMLKAGDFVSSKKMTLLR